MTNNTTRARKAQKEQVAIVTTQVQEPAVKLSTQVRMPIEIFSRVDQDAKAASTTPGAFILGLVAKHYGMTVAGPPSRGKKYASEEEKKAANKARREERRDLIKKLLEQYQAQTEDAAEAVAAQ